MNYALFTYLYIEETVRMTTTQLSRNALSLAPISCQSKNDKGHRAGAVLFALGSLLLGTIGVFVHYAHTDPLTATWFRCAFGWVGMSLWLLWRKQTGQLRLNRRTGGWVLSASLLMVSAWGLFFTAIERTSTGVAVVLFHIQPLWVLLLGVVWMKAPIDRQGIAFVCSALFGLILATGVLERASLPADTGSQQAYWLGVVACLIGSLCTASVTLIAKRLRDVPAGILAWWQCAVGTLILWVWPVKQGWPDWGQSWAWLAGLGLIHTGLAYTLMYAGMVKLTTGRIAALQFLYPALAIIVDWLFLDHPLGGVQLAGIALMFAAVGAAERRPSR